MNVLLVFTEIKQKFGALRSQHGLASISAVLKNAGSAVVLAYFAEIAEAEVFQRKIEKLRPAVIGFYSTAEQFDYVRQLIEMVPKGIFTICGGPHPTCYPECIETVPRLDAVCIGEGEYPMLELVKALENGTDHTGIKNLWVRHNGKIIRNETRPFIEDLNSLPYEDRELFDTQESIDSYGLSQIRVLTSRGCPYECTYCSNKRTSRMQSGRYVRFRNADHIFGEIKQLQEKYRFKEIFFDDDIFMMNRKVLDQFHERYPREVGKPFVFCGRVEACRKELLQKLHDSGGRRIDFGVESGNEEIRSMILKRRMTNQQIIDATQWAKEAGLQVKTLNMVGLPEETKDKFADTIKINQKINPDVVSLHVFFPYPGTELYDYCLKKGYYEGDLSLPEGYVSRRQSVLNLPGFTKKEITRCFHSFGFKVFRKYSLVKAIGYALMYSEHGEFWLDMTKHFRTALRRILKGL